MGYNDTRIAALVSNSFDQSRGLDHFLARTPRQREEIFRLRYEAYRRKDLIAKNPTGSLHDQYDSIEAGASIFGVTLFGELVATIRLSLLSRANRCSATFSAFKDYLEPLVEKGKSIADGSRLAVQCGDRIARRNIILYTLSLALLYSKDLNADFGAICVRESHVSFYNRYGFELVSGPRPYKAMLAPQSLMVIPLEKKYSNTRPPVSLESATRVKLM